MGILGFVTVNCLVKDVVTNIGQFQTLIDPQTVLASLLTADAASHPLECLVSQVQRAETSNNKFCWKRETHVFPTTSLYN